MPVTGADMARMEINALNIHDMPTTATAWLLDDGDVTASQEQVKKAYVIPNDFRTCNGGCFPVPDQPILSTIHRSL
jgi:hypothetical protein